MVDRLTKWLQTPEQLLATLRDETATTPPLEGFYSLLIAQTATMAQSWHKRIAEDRTQFLRNVIERVIIRSDYVEIRLRTPALVNEILGGATSTAGLLPIVSIECPFRHVRQGCAVRLIIGDTSLTTDASRKAILKAIARARRWYEQITTGQASSIEQLAGMHGVSPRFIHMHMKLVPISPQSVDSYMTKPELMPISLDDLLTAVPMNWREQTFGQFSKYASQGCKSSAPLTSQAACRLLGLFQHR